MSARASFPGDHGERTLRERMSVVESALVELGARVDHHDYVEGKIASLDAGLSSVVHRLDDERKERREFQEALLVEIRKVHVHAKEGREKATSALDVLANAKDFASLVPPGYRGAASVAILLILFLSTLFSGLERLGVLR